MTPPCEFDRLTPGVCVWHRYDAQVKAELFASGLGTTAGLYLIDPILPRPPELDETIAATPVVGVLVTNVNHARAAAQFAEELRVPIFAGPIVHPEFGSTRATICNVSAMTTADLTVVPIEGAPAGEVALHSPREGGTLVLGDALIHMGSHGFTFLPPKYCENAKQMRRSLQVLLKYECERILFAHGAPLVTQARARLQTLLQA